MTQYNSNVQNVLSEDQRIERGSSDMEQHLYYNDDSCTESHVASGKCEASKQGYLYTYIHILYASSDSNRHPQDYLPRAKALGNYAPEISPAYIYMQWNLI